MPLVKISLLKGRSKEEKEALLDAIHSALRAAFKIPENNRNLRIFESNDVFITLKEPPLDNWGLRGGLPASEADLGFKLDV